MTHSALETPVPVRSINLLFTLHYLHLGRGNFWHKEQISWDAAAALRYCAYRKIIAVKWCLLVTI